MDTARTPLSEAEFEEIMNRNRAISSSAISRAVSDASAGLCISVLIFLIYVIRNGLKLCAILKIGHLHLVFIFIFPNHICVYLKDIEGNYVSK